MWVTTTCPRSQGGSETARVIPTTIKNPANSIYIKWIFEQHPEAKPIDRISHGYSLAKVNKTQKLIYLRDKYRYKKRK